jgi:Mg2+ transporter MgtE
MTDQEKASHIVDLLRYDEDCAGGLMAKELMVANVNWTVVQCIEEIRRQAEKVEKIYSVYVVNDQGFLLGRVSLKKIILASDQMKIADIYDPDVISVETYRKDDEVAAIMRKYDLEAIPVVNVQRKLLGRITIDDIVDVIAEQAEEDRQLMSGISENVEEYDSVWTVTRSRLPWLIIGMVGGMLGASFIGLFEKDLIIIPAMAFFIPLITATGGNVGIQSSSMVLQTLASKTSLGNGFYERFIKMLLVALVNGVVISALVFIINFIFGQSPQLALVGPDNIWNLMNLRMCDRIGTGRPKEDPYRLRKYKAMIEEAVRAPISVKMLKIDGKKIMEVNKIQPGPKVGMILNALMEEVLDNPDLNTEDYLYKKSIELFSKTEAELKSLSDIGKHKREEMEEREIEKIRDRHNVK